MTFVDIKRKSLLLVEFAIKMNIIYDIIKQMSFTSVYTRGVIIQVSKVDMQVVIGRLVMKEDPKPVSGYVVLSCDSRLL